MVPPRQLCPELLGRKDRGIDRATCLRLNGADRAHDLGERNVSDHHQIQIAFRLLLPASHRPVDERDGDPVGQRCEGLTQQPDRADCFRDESAELLVDRGALISLEIDVSALSASPKDPALRQTPELSLDMSDSETREGDDLAQIKTAIRTTEEKPEDGASRLGEQSLGNGVVRAHDGRGCTQKETILGLSRTQ